MLRALRFMRLVESSESHLRCALAQSTWQGAHISQQIELAALSSSV